MTEYERQVAAWKRKQAVIDWLIIGIFLAVALAVIRIVP
jgi:hypothetical protein